MTRSSPLYCIKYIIILYQLLYYYHIILHKFDCTIDFVRYCFDVRTCTGGLDSLVNVWHLNVESLENVYQLNNNELHSTMHGHTAAITCLAIASNGLFAVSGSEDKLVLVWGLTVGSAVFTFSVSVPSTAHHPLPPHNIVSRAFVNPFFPFLLLFRLDRRDINRPSPRWK